MDTTMGIQGTRAQPFVDAESAHVSGVYIGRSHGAAVVTQVFTDAERSHVLRTLSSERDVIIGYFAELAKSYAIPYIIALADGFAEATGDRIASYMVGKMPDFDPAELALQIAAARRGIDAGFDAAIEELCEAQPGSHDRRAEPRTRGGSTDGPPRPTESAGNA